MCVELEVRLLSHYSGLLSKKKQKVQVKGRTEIQLESAHRVEITRGAGVTGGC